MPTNKFQRALSLIKAAIKASKTSRGRCQVEDVTLCTGYAEPGYTDPESGVIAFGNWNPVTEYIEETQSRQTRDDIPRRLCEALEKLGAEIEWSDEWIFCSGCNKAIRCQPDSYSWQRAYCENEGEPICRECINPVAVLEQLENKSNTCLTLDNVDPAEHDYTRVEGEFEHGLHGGQDADSSKIGAGLRQQGITRFLFRLEEKSQFYFTFSVWIHADEWPRFDPEKLAAFNTRCALDPAEGLKRALQSAPIPQPGAGVNITTCDVSTGKSETRVMSRSEFIRGNAKSGE